MLKLSCRLFALLALLFFVSGCSQKVYVVHYPSSKEPPLMKAKEKPVYSAPIYESHMPLIIIDPGHGGKDFGTEARAKPPFKEKNLNLMTAKLLEGYLQQMGYRTLLTRSQDLFVSLDRRATIANQYQADLFVSVHYNSAPSTQAHGIEVFYYEGDRERTSASKQFAETVLKSVINSTEARSRGVKHGNLAVLRKTTMPAILVEGGFITNEKELAKLKDPSYIKTLAWGIAQGIQGYQKQRFSVPTAVKTTKKEH
ncbi:MAG: N-acetylmuramoyl-L-alanine amidase family protein [Parachlamydiaceae bacterium]